MEIIVDIDGMTYSIDQLLNQPFPMVEPISMDRRLITGDDEWIDPIKIELIIESGDLIDHLVIETSHYLEQHLVTIPCSNLSSALFDYLSDHGSARPFTEVWAIMIDMIALALTASGPELAHHQLAGGPT